MSEYILYVTDLHGDKKTYERLLKAGKEKDIAALVIGGDIAPGFHPQHQRTFLDTWLIPKLKKFKKKDIFIMMGNDDQSTNMSVLGAAEKDGVVKIMHDRIHKIGKYFLTGYSFINAAPFLMMDWVKNEKDIEKDLKKISKKSDPKKTIYCFHAPPFNTDLDVTYSGQHVGSEAILNFIKKEQPYLSLHGHIHESPLMTSTIGQIIGKTMCFNPGDCVIMKINIDKPKDIGIINP